MEQKGSGRGLCSRREDDVWRENEVMWPPLCSLSFFDIFIYSVHVHQHNIKNHLPRICGERLAMLGAKHNVFGGTFFCFVVLDL